MNYRNASDAQRLGLADIKGGAVYLGVDSKTANMDPNATFGRSSVRVYSMQQYKFGLFIYDIAHFPAKACGVWPAMWMYGANWPKNGEIDIYEGWNDNFEMTRQTLHTSPGCRVLGAGQTNKMEWIDCNVANKSQPFNFGCSSDRLDGSWGSSNGGICKSSASLPPSLSGGKASPTLTLFLSASRGAVDPQRHPDVELGARRRASRHRNSRTRAEHVGHA